ncbi:arsenate reductase (glutaredoxin) [Roseovarius amoyensis]|uniref:arsenate reductase (glutaredoxin) n=1 Tax=Roseovarius amoyensis TaxID=2211448 RepID=UPI000DBE17BB|nr:arsenate reductase (glutaredoxin) [Roseovarius amoyensis]
MTVIWHNPRCSKSRQTLALVQERGEEVTIRRYLDEPPSAEELREAQALLDLPAIEMMRTGEALFSELGLSKTDPDDKLIEAMATHPRLIERPVVFASGRAVIARPPERALDLL